MVEAPFPGKHIYYYAELRETSPVLDVFMMDRNLLL